ncbi:defensin-like protein 75 [Senna tora]|uniref:Defensin-like protein 75 n=1 Tax=Senna tora TaxID=362788 RepID=A0A834TPZ9_9FABA|nr:defensin-like protein 75 [Senna tora]
MATKSALLAGVLVCFLLLLASEEANGITAPVCVGECSSLDDCQQLCVAKGYIGGGCFRATGQQLQCCCNGNI